MKYIVILFFVLAGCSNTAPNDLAMLEMKLDYENEIWLLESRLDSLNRDLEKYYEEWSKLKELNPSSQLKELLVKEVKQSLLVDEGLEEEFIKIHTDIKVHVYEGGRAVVYLDHPDSFKGPSGFHCLLFYYDNEWVTMHILNYYECYD